MNPPTGREPGPRYASDHPPGRAEPPPSYGPPTGALRPRPVSTPRRKGPHPMSRHILTPKDPTTTTWVVVGWDRPLATYYAQVWPAGDDAPAVWLGALEQITDPKIILDAAAPTPPSPRTCCSPCSAKSPPLRWPPCSSTTRSPTGDSSSGPAHCPAASRSAQHPTTRAAPAIARTPRPAGAPRSAER